MNTRYRLCQSAPSGTRTVTVYVGGFVDRGDGRIDYYWTSSLAAASRLPREQALSAATLVEVDQAAYRATRTEGYRREYPARAVVVRAVTGGEPLAR